MITRDYLRANPDHIFVFGDNLVRKRHGGAAKLRDEPNVYGFVTKRYPNMKDGSFYRPDEYRAVFKEEMVKLEAEIQSNPGKTYLISRVGAGLANRYHIWEMVILPQIHKLEKYPNVRFV